MKEKGGELLWEVFQTISSGAALFSALEPCTDARRQNPPPMTDFPPLTSFPPIRSPHHRLFIEVLAASPSIVS